MILVEGWLTTGLKWSGLFNKLHIEIVKKTCGKPVLGRSQNPKERRDTIEHFIQHFKDLGK